MLLQQIALISLLSALPSKILFVPEGVFSDESLQMESICRLKAVNKVNYLFLSVSMLSGSTGRHSLRLCVLTLYGQTKSLRPQTRARRPVSGFNANALR
jgi:hypothetical protein